MTLLTKRKASRFLPGRFLCAGFLGQWLLRRTQQLRESGGVHVAEERRPRRQQRRLQEVVVEGVKAARHAVNVARALINPGPLAVKVQADQGAFVIEVTASPALQVTQEVV